MYKLELESKKSLVLVLAIIIISSFFLKLYTIDFSVSEIQDTWIYVLRGIAFSNGDYAESPIKPSGYPLILSFFFKIFEPENFVDYVNIARVLNIIIASATIFPLYLLGRHFLDKKFSLLLSFFFAFQPQLNFNVGLGISEPIFLLFLILSYHFLLKSNSKYSNFLSFSFLGLLFWIRFTGLLFIIPLIICHFILHRDVKNLILCTILCLLIISPIMVMRNDQYGNPLFFSGVGGGDRESLIPEKLDMDWFVFSIVNLFTAFGTMSLPHLIFLLPLGILSFKIIPPNARKIFFPTLILFLMTFLPLLIQYSIDNSARPLYHLYPFMMIFSALFLYSFYKFESNFFTVKNKKIIISLIIIFIISSSVLITVGIGDYGYGKKDVKKLNELFEYNTFLLDNIDGNLFWSKGESARWMNIAMIEGSNQSFKNYKIDTTIGFDVYNISSLKEYYPTNLNLIFKTDSDSIDSFLDEIIQLDIKYLSIGEKNQHVFLDEIFENESKFPFLKKTFDSNERGFKDYNVKLFEIDIIKLKNYQNGI